MKRPRRIGDPGIPIKLLKKYLTQKTKLSFNQLSKMKLEYMPTKEEFIKYILKDEQYLGIIKKYAEYSKKYGIEKMPAIRFVDGRLEDGGHRLNMILFLSQKNPEWLNVPIPVEFYETKTNWKELEKTDPHAFLLKKRAASYI